MDNDERHLSNFYSLVHLVLIMVGSHAGEHHGIKQFSGSRANAILHHAASDVLIVETSFRERKDNKLKR